ncbi:MAG: pyridoxal phosphate-dependent aminotransferase [Deltaproteobacteria bacterium]|nr:pyridoxal phosphate-dependent aminotransferase [Deltaproteobacteria bacterium]
MLSKRVNMIHPSPTLKITALAKKMRSEGKPIISFAAGEPDFDTPNSIKEAAIKALNEGRTKYTATSGILELKEAICRKLENENGLKYSPDEIIVSNGAKQCIFNALLSLLNEHETILIPLPYWVSYPEIVNFAGAKYKLISGDKNNKYKFSGRALSEAIDSSVKAIIINSPSNPTGAVYTKEELLQIASVLRDNPQIWILSDDIYEKLIYTHESFTSILNIAPDLRYRTIIINGLSKSFSMTGFRIGYAAANSDIIAAMERIQDHTTSNASTISQYAALYALSNQINEVEAMRLEFKRRMNIMYEGISSIKGLYPIKPDGAFYIFTDISSFIGKKYKGSIIRSSEDFSLKLLENYFVATIPGLAFGTDNFIRLSFATSEREIHEGISKISEFIQEIS